MQVLRAFNMVEAKVVTKESKAIAICKYALLAIEISTAEVVCIKKHDRAQAMAL